MGIFTYKDIVFKDLKSLTNKSNFVIITSWVSQAVTAAVELAMAQDLKIVYYAPLIKFISKVDVKIAVF